MNGLPNSELEVLDSRPGEASPSCLSLFFSPSLCDFKQVS